MAELIEGFLAIRDNEGCKCKAYAARMDAWGPEGCTARRDEIVEHLVSNQDIIAAAIMAANVPGCSLLSKLTSTRAARPLLKIGANWLLTKAIAQARENVTQRVTSYVRRSKMPVVDLPPADPFPFPDRPRFTLISHLWPRRGVWQYHADRLAQSADLFERKVLGVALDDTTDDIEMVRDAFPGWEILEFVNNPKLREVVTYQAMLPMVTTDDPNQIIVCHHGKGVQEHNQESDAVGWWVDAMYRTVIENPAGIIEAMENGASVAGSFRRKGRMLGTRNRWHFSGTYYAVRATRIHPVERFPFRGMWWGTESWPGDYFPLEHSHCVFGDGVADLYKVENQPRAELEKWSAVRCS